MIWTIASSILSTIFTESIRSKNSSCQSDSFAFLMPFTNFLVFSHPLISTPSEMSFLIALSYAFTDEIHQLFVPGRGGRLTDVLIDLLGIIIATQLIKRLKR